jgi:hypothetical protein
VGQHSGAIAASAAALAGPPLPRFAMSERYAAAAEFAQKARSRALPATVQAPSDGLIARSARRGTANPPRLELLFADDAWRDRVACYYGGERLGVQWSADGRELTTRAGSALEQGRHRYNCTARDAQGEWYWLSQPWVVE